MDKREIQQLTEQALSALRQGNHVRALAIADQLSPVAAGDPNVHVIRAHALLRLGTRDEALEEARRAAELDPHNENTHLLLGMAAWETNRLTLAQESLERAVELSGRRPFFLEEYAWFMVSERGPRLAREAAEAAVSAEQSSSTAWAALGLALFRLRRFREAEKALRRALRLEPGNVRAQSAMVKVLQEKGQVDKAAALADVMQDIPAAEDIVQSVREEEKWRRIHQAMLERPAILQSVVRQPRSHRWLALLVGLATVAMLVVLFRPPNPLVVLALAVLPVLLLWRWVASMD
jgi:Tfp pilus assembly protein PilF